MKDLALAFVLTGLLLSLGFVFGFIIGVNTTWEKCLENFDPKPEQWRQNETIKCPL